MIEEIVYTSVPQGLKPGSRGFCTVASTPGMARTLVATLESLSGYRHLAEPGSAAAINNPIAYSYLRGRIGGRSVAIVSRVADAGHDYSGRTNKLAHHIAFSADQTNQAGPVVTQQQEGFHERKWVGEPRVLDARLIPQVSSSSAVCDYWKETTGDARWGGVVAGRLVDEPSGTVWIIYPPGVNMLRLLGEALALLPAENRWDVTYSTFYTKLPPGLECRVRCVVDGTSEATQVRKKYDLKPLDLCQVLGEPPDESIWTQSAQTGKPPRPVSQPPRPVSQPPRPVSQPPRQASRIPHDQSTSDTGPALEVIDEDLGGLSLEQPPLPRLPGPLPRPPSGRRRGSRPLARRLAWIVGGGVAILFVLFLGVVVTKTLGLNIPELIGNKLAQNDKLPKDCWRFR